METQVENQQHDSFADESKAVCECLNALSKLKGMSRAKAIEIVRLAISDNASVDTVESHEPFDENSEASIADSDASWKPKKPYEGFPLYPHRCGQWVKKIKGKVWYFGVLDDPYGALNKFNLQIDDILDGKDPRKIVMKVSDVCETCRVKHEAMTSLDNTST